MKSPNFDNMLWILDQTFYLYYCTDYTHGQTSFSIYVTSIGQLPALSLQMANVANSWDCVRLSNDQLLTFDINKTPLITKLFYCQPKNLTANKTDKTFVQHEFAFQHYLGCRDAQHAIFLTKKMLHKMLRHLAAGKGALHSKMFSLLRKLVSTFNRKKL